LGETKIATNVVLVVVAVGRSGVCDVVLLEGLIFFFVEMEFE